MTGARGNSDERPMATPETEIVVEDPTAPSDNSPSVVSTRTVDIVVSLLLLALAALLCFDNWRTGIAWAADGPQAGYFPFYIGLIICFSALATLAQVFYADWQAKQKPHRPRLPRRKRRSSPGARSSRCWRCW